MTNVVRVNYFSELYFFVYTAQFLRRADNIASYNLSGNASENRLIPPNPPFATPELSKRKNRNPIFYRQYKTLKPLMRSALPAAVTRRGELQQPRAFLLLKNRPGLSAGSGG